MSGFDTNPFSAAAGENPFEDPSVTQAVNSTVTSVDQFNPFPNVKTTGTTSPAVLQPTTEPAPKEVAAAAQADLLRQQQELERKAAELERREEEMNQRNRTQPGENQRYNQVRNGSPTETEPGQNQRQNRCQNQRQNRSEPEIQPGEKQVTYPNSNSDPRRGSGVWRLGGLEVQGSGGSGVWRFRGLGGSGVWRFWGSGGSGVWEVQGSGGSGVWRFRGSGGSGVWEVQGSGGSGSVGSGGSGGSGSGCFFCLRETNTCLELLSECVVVFQECVLCFQECFRSVFCVSGVFQGVKENNWPPLPGCCPIKPCFYQDFSEEIPPEHQRVCKMIYLPDSLNLFPERVGLPGSLHHSALLWSGLWSCLWCGSFCFSGPCAFLCLVPSGMSEAFQVRSLLVPPGLYA
ncbi:hypothetical protein WMY93_032266 [Mugilogobius chulae]|uniref:Secretory carrier-associated membrane protein n=1 Tax=Mugilogobius chulae TaxID=88201 RepID=A0AAW0MEN4_9GOBI